MQSEQSRPVPRTVHQYLAGEMVIVIDCADTARSAAFWTAVLGYVTAGPGNGHYAALLPANGTGIEVLLQQVPDSKQGKNRVHIDLRTSDLAAETERVVSLGAARLTSEPLIEDGLQWHVCADPDGNEFCVLQPLA